MSEPNYGWIDDVQRKADHYIVWGRIVDAGEELEFSVDMEDVPECQRESLQVGSYVSFPNGYLLVHKTIWTTYDMEEADKLANEMWRKLHWY